MEKINIRYKYIKGAAWASDSNIWRCLQDTINELIDKINELEEKLKEKK